MQQDNPDFFYNLGAVCLELGKNQAAKQYYKQALKLNPDLRKKIQYQMLPEKIKTELNR